MKSDLAKVLHEVDGKAMIDYVIDAVRPLEPSKIAVIVGNRMEQVIAHLKNSRVVFAVQYEQRGTADAVKCGYPAFGGFEGHLLILCGDSPLIRTDTIRALYEHHLSKNASATVLTGILDDPEAYGRIIRDDNGDIERIVEFTDASPEIRAIKEVNSSTYIFNSEDLWDAIGKIDDNNKQGEFYLTDVIEVLKGEGRKVAAFNVEDSSEILGVNTKEQLAHAGNKMKERIYTLNPEEK